MPVFQGKQPYRRTQGDMFLHDDPGLKLLACYKTRCGHDVLYDHFTTIHCLIDIVDRASGNLFPVFKDRLMDF